MKASCPCCQDWHQYAQNYNQFQNFGTVFGIRLIIILMVKINRCFVDITAAVTLVMPPCPDAAMKMHAFTVMPVKLEDKVALAVTIKELIQIGLRIGVIALVFIGMKPRAVIMWLVSGELYAAKLGPPGKFRDQHKGEDQQPEFGAA